MSSEKVVYMFEHFDSRGIMNLALAAICWGVLGLAVWAWRAIR